MADKWDKHKIETKGGPINVRPYRLAVNLEPKVDEAIQNLWENKTIKNIIEPKDYKYNGNIGILVYIRILS